MQLNMTIFAIFHWLIPCDGLNPPVHLENPLGGCITTIYPRTKCGGDQLGEIEWYDQSHVNIDKAFKKCVKKCCSVHSQCKGVNLESARNPLTDRTGFICQMLRKKNDNTDTPSDDGCWDNGNIKYGHIEGKMNEQITVATKCKTCNIL